METEIKVGKSMPKLLCKWWRRSRPCKRGIQLNNDVPPPCVEFYVPWWAWPIELAHRVIFGIPKLCAGVKRRGAEKKSGEVYLRTDFAWPPPPPLLPQGGHKIFYVASKTKHAWRWRALRNRGHRINSTWIYESSEGQSPDYADLAVRCIDEASTADVLILYCERDENLKGALIEVGAALAAGKEVRLVGDCPSISRVFRKHPLWREYGALVEALA